MKFNLNFVYTLWAFWIIQMCFLVIFHFIFQCSFSGKKNIRCHIQNGDRYKSAVVQVNNASNHQQRSKARLRNVMLLLHDSCFLCYLSLFPALFLNFLYLFSVIGVFSYWLRYKCVAKNPRGETDGTIRLYCE